MSCPLTRRGGRRTPESKVAEGQLHKWRMEAESLGLQQRKERRLSGREKGVFAVGRPTCSVLTGRPNLWACRGSSGGNLRPVRIHVACSVVTSPVLPPDSHCYGSVTFMESFLLSATQKKNKEVNF